MLRSPSSSPERDLLGVPFDFVPERDNKKPTTNPLDFDGLLESPLILHEDLTEGCGGQLWPAGMTLTKYMLQNHKRLHGKRVVEIGAGGGLVGLAVAKARDTIGDETNQLIITDQIPMFELMKKNIALNNLENKVMAEIYDWGTPPPASIIPPTLPTSYPDIILAADCVYFEPTFPLLLHTLVDLIGPTTTCFFCFKRRRKADMRFISAMLKQFDAVVPEYDGKANDRKQGIHLYIVRRKDKDCNQEDFLHRYDIVKKAFD